MKQNVTFLISYIRCVLVYRSPWRARTGSSRRLTVRAEAWDTVDSAAISMVALVIYLYRTILPN